MIVTDLDVCPKFFTVGWVIPRPDFVPTLIGLAQLEDRNPPSFHIFSVIASCASLLLKRKPFPYARVSVMRSIFPHISVLSGNAIDVKTFICLLLIKENTSI